MANGKKVGILLALLATPVLIVVFLEQFGEHHYTIPTDPTEAEGLSAQVPAGVLGQSLQLPAQLFNHQDQPVADTLFHNRATVVYPLPESDADTARLILEKLTRVQDVFEAEPGAQIIAVVATNNTDSLSKLSTQYRSQPQIWQFLANTTERSVMRNSMPPRTDAATLLLVDQDQKVRGYYDGAQEKELDRLVAETRILLRDVKR